MKVAPHQSSQAARARCFGLITRRERWALTRRGCAVVLLLLVFGLWLGVRGVHPFLAVDVPLRGGVLVVEGWGSDEMLRAALMEFNTHGYQRLCVTGGPIEKGAPFSEFGTWAEMGAATLAKFGAATNTLHAVPAPRAKRDRTFASAVALRTWLAGNGGVPKSVTVFSAGPHARRSRLLFSRALGRDTGVGVIAHRDEEYDPARWWSSSQGARVVISEVIAYAYARVIPPRQP